MQLAIGLFCNPINVLYDQTLTLVKNSIYYISVYYYNTVAITQLFPAFILRTYVDIKSILQAIGLGRITSWLAEVRYYSFVLWSQDNPKDKDLQVCTW